MEQAPGEKRMEQNEEKQDCGKLKDEKDQGGSLNFA